MELSNGEKGELSVSGKLVLKSFKVERGSSFKATVTEGEPERKYRNVFRYAGYYFDEESELYYLNARYYDPGIQRFLSEDTYRGDIGNPLTLNYYGYVSGNPVMYYDPSGHKLKDVLSAEGALAITKITAGGIGLYGGIQTANPLIAAYSANTLTAGASELASLIANGDTSMAVDPMGLTAKTVGGAMGNALGNKKAGETVGEMAYLGSDAVVNGYGMYTASTKIDKLATPLVGVLTTVDIFSIFNLVDKKEQVKQEVSNNKFFDMDSRSWIEHVDPLGSPKELEGAGYDEKHGFIKRTKVKFDDGSDWHPM